MTPVSYSPSEIDAMIGSLEENMEANPGYADLLNKLGLLYMLKNHFEEAHSQFQQCLAVRPSHLEARGHLAILHFRRGSWKDAEKILLACREGDPHNGMWHHALGVVLLMQERQTSAAKSFQRAAQEDSFYRLCYEKYGVLRDRQVCLGASQVSRLVQSLERFCQVRLQHFVGDCYVEMGEPEKAIREFRKANRIDTNHYLAYVKIGQLYDMQGKFRKAIQEFQKAVKRFPDCATAYAHMSYACAGLGDFDCAAAALRKAVEIAPNQWEFRYQLGLLYDALEMPAEAIEEFKVAVEMNPKSTFARINLGVLYEKTGRVNRALEQYEVVAELVTEDKDLINRIDQMKKKAPSRCPSDS